MKKTKTLLVEPQANYRRHLCDLFQKAFPSYEVLRTPSFEKGLEMYSETDFALCIIGSGLDEQQQLAFLEKRQVRPTEKPCAMIVVLHETDNDTLLSLVRSGAHGLLLPPFSEESLAEVIKTALTAAHKPSHPADGSSEQSNSLPWILETFANRLENVAVRLKTAEQGGTLLEATPKTIKEALLSTIAASSETDEKAIENVLRILLKDQQH